jgi:uncharacterized protein YbjT (DUF2867 family)
MTFALTGGTGFVGKAVVEHALETGHSLAALARQPQEPRDGITWVPGDLADRKALAALVRGSAAVVHVAGVVNAFRVRVFAVRARTRTFGLWRLEGTRGEARDGQRA